MVRLPNLTDLIPRRNATYVRMWLGAVCVVLLLGGLYALGAKLASRTTDGTIAALDLDAEGSIACWLSIVLFFSCALTTLIIRRLRAALGAGSTERRVWLAMSVLWCTMSLDEGASLHEAFKELMTLATGTRIMGDGSIYWVVPYFILLTAAGLYLLVRAWRVPSAVACLASAGASFALAIAGQLDLILAGRPKLETWFEESCEMMGQLFILLTLALYARSVISATHALTIPGHRSPTRQRDSGLVARNIVIS